MGYTLGPCLAFLPYLPAPPLTSQPRNLNPDPQYQQIRYGNKSPKEVGGTIAEKLMKWQRVAIV